MMNRRWLTVPGIYAIENTINGYCYIGSATNLSNRRYAHLYHLRHGSHHSNHLQRAFDKYGEDAFVFLVLLICERFELRRYEKALVLVHQPKYNMIEVNESCEWCRSEESRRKTSRSLKGHKFPPPTEETKRKISATLTGRKNGPLTNEHRAKLSASKKGRTFSDEHKRALSDAKKRQFEGHVYAPKKQKKYKPCDQGEISNSSPPWKGGHLSESHKQALSEQRKGFHWTNEFKVKLSRAHSHLSDDIIREIRQRIATGESQASIGKQLGITSATISRINTRRVYGWLE